MEGLARRRPTHRKGLTLRSAENRKFGWGGRIRTFTIHINSVVSYRLDHAPAVYAAATAIEQTKWAPPHQARQRVSLR